MRPPAVPFRLPVSGSVSRRATDFVSPVVILGLILLTGCSGADRSERSEALLEAGFRQLIADHASPASPGVLCIGLGSPEVLVDAPPRVMGALNNIEAEIRPASDCTVASRAYETLSGRPAVIFHIREIDCDSRERCTFLGGRYDGAPGASETRYRVERRAGRWLATRDPDAPRMMS